jgi:hypothetical protein
MITLRLAIPAVLAAAAVAGCITYFVTPAPLEQVKADQPLPPTNVTSRPDSGIARNIQRATTEDRIDAFERAAEAILKRAQNATASAADAPLIIGRIPLPKPRPILPP